MQLFILLLTENTFYNQAENKGGEGADKRKSDAEGDISAPLCNCSLVRKARLFQIYDVHFFALSLGKNQVEVTVVHQIAQRAVYFFKAVSSLCRK